MAASSELMDAHRAGPYRISDGAHAGGSYSKRGGYTESITARGDLIAVGDASGHIDVWRTGGKIVRRIRTTDYVVRSLDFSPDGTRLVSGSYDAQIRLWRIA